MTDAAVSWGRLLALKLRRNVVLLIAYTALGALLSVRAGQDTNWDLANYHFYDVFQFLNGRLDRDIDVAGIQTYVNPLFDLPFFTAVYYLRWPAIVVGACLGAFHGLALFFVHKLVLVLLSASRRVIAHAGGALAAITSAAGAGFYSEIGLTMGDTTMCVFVTAAIWLLVSRAARDGAPSLRAAAGAGLLVGAATGGKLVAGIYLAGFLVGIVLVGRSITGRVVRGLAFGVLATIGMALTIGYWVWEMKVHFGNPAFPYLQNVLKEPTRPFAKAFLPRDTGQKTFYPFYFALRPTPFMVSEVSFNDARLAAAYLAAGLFLVVAGARLVFRRGALKTVEDGRALLLVACMVASFAVWQRQISIYRYAIPLETLASALVIGSLVYCFRSGLRAVLIAVPVCAYLLTTAQPPNWGRMDWQPTYFGMEHVPLDEYEGATIFLWEMPNGYLVPYFPKSATFVRLMSNWDRFRVAPFLRTRIEWAAQRANRQKTYLLETNPGADLAKKEYVLELLGLTLDLSACRGFSSTMDAVRICAVRYLDK